MKTSLPNIVKSICCLVGVFVFLGCNNPSSTQNIAKTQKDTTAQKLPVKSMHDDLSIMWSAIKELHPGYGIYTPADSLEKSYNNTYASIKEPLFEKDFIARVYPFLCKLRCGHTQLEKSAGYEAPANLNVPRLPFEVLVKNHRAWVTTHQIKDLATGDEIISMNGTPVSEIINHGFDLYCADGYGETFKELFLSEYDGFEDACNKFYHWPGPYQIKLRLANGKLKTVQVSPLAASSPAPPPSPAIDNYADWTVAKNTGNLPLRFSKTSSIALFETKPFSYSDTLVYQEAFKQIHKKGIKNLILDLRHNTGGDVRVATRLLSYLADAPFIIIKDAKSRIPNPPVNRFAKYFDTSITGNFNEGYKPGAKEGAWYHIDIKPVFGRLYGPQPLTGTDHFDGNLYVLIDGATFSSGALFTAALKAQRKNVKFIGRETAGAEEGCNGMTLQKLTLPNTKISVVFPWMRVISAAKTSTPGRGIMPDHTVVYSPQDIVDKKDGDLEQALAIIK